ncbi:MAG TPA: lysylphosphatidylglycerol synthase transmembrane domain-containing protein, partial [Acidimicrobiales bacterium]
MGRRSSLSGATVAKVPRRSSRSAAQRTLRGTIKTLAFLAVFIYFGIPAITNARDAVDRLTDVEPGLLALGLGLQLLSLVAYSQLTKAALPRRAVRLPVLFRIQLTTRAVTNVVPGGSAAGSAIGYRMLTLAGVRGADAGFALVASALGSALLLNVILWVTLIVSIPAAGFRPIYVSMALIAVLVIGAFGFVVFGLMRGESQAERFVRAVARRVRFLDEERLAKLVNRLAERLRELVEDPALLRRLTVWATANWLLDAASLWVFLRAFGAETRVDSLLVSFCVANISTSIPITPGGLGVLDATLVAMLALFGYGDEAGLAVPMYRLAQYWLPIPVGTLAYV